MEMGLVMRIQGCEHHALKLGRHIRCDDGSPISIHHGAVSQDATKEEPDSKAPATHLKTQDYDKEELGCRSKFLNV